MRVGPLLISFASLRNQIEGGQSGRAGLSLELHLPFFHFFVYANQLSEKRNVVRNHEFSEVKWFPVDSLPDSSVGFVRSQVVALERQHHKGEKLYGKNVFT